VGKDDVRHVSVAVERGNGRRLKVGWMLHGRKVLFWECRGHFRDENGFLKAWLGRREEDGAMITRVIALGGAYSGIFQFPSDDGSSGDDEGNELYSYLPHGL
jgi:hypothetical protein